MPNSITEINHKLTQSQFSLTSSRFFDKEFKTFKRANARTFNKNKVFQTVISFMENKIKDDKCVEEEIFFTNLECLTNDMFTTTKMNVYYDARFEQFNQKIRDKLNNYIVLLTQYDFSIVSNFFLSIKKSKKSL